MQNRELLTSTDSLESRVPKVSVVVPFFNEVESVPRLLEAIAESLTAHHIPYEIVAVDDGSDDGTTSLLAGLGRERSDLRVVILRRNYGQTAAMAAGFNHAHAGIIVTLDGDLQNDPADIPRLLDKLEEGYDLVSGWRHYRQDAPLTRLLPSKMANWIIGRVTGLTLHDYGCSLKAYRTELVSDMHLYGELHRFLPVLAAIEGARIAEVPVNHFARQHGKSKYGLGRTFPVLMDLLTVYFMKTFLTRPMHAFGWLGLISTLVGLGLGGYLTYIKFWQDAAIGDRPLLTLAVLLCLGGLYLFSFGLLAELLMRTYHESQGRQIYRVRDVIESAPD